MLKKEKYAYAYLFSPTLENLKKFVDTEMLGKWCSKKSKISSCIDNSIHRPNNKFTILPKVNASDNEPTIP